MKTSVVDEERAFDVASRVSGRGYRPESAEVREAGRAIATGMASAFSADGSAAVGDWEGLDVASRCRRFAIFLIGFSGRRCGVVRALEIAVNHSGRCVRVSAVDAGVKGDERRDTTQESKGQEDNDS